MQFIKLIIFRYYVTIENVYLGIPVFVKNVALNFEPGFIGGSSETVYKKIIFFSRLPITYTIFQENWKCYRLKNNK